MSHRHRSVIMMLLTALVSAARRHVFVLLPSDPWWAKLRIAVVCRFQQIHKNILHSYIKRLHKD